MILQFSEWLNESSLNSLFQSTVDAFPYTTKRQHSTDTIKITKMSWTPFVGLKTLYVKGLAQNEGREYTPAILFKNVKYGEGVELLASDNKNYRLEKLTLNGDVLVRCGCGDFRWRFNYYDFLDHSLYGKKAKKYEAKYRPGSANPEEMPGMCKHLLKLIKILKSSEIIS